MHSRTSLSPEGESAAEQEEPPGTWGDAVERKEVVWGVSCWSPALKEDKTGVFWEGWASLQALCFCHGFCSVCAMAAPWWGSLGELWELQGSARGQWAANGLAWLQVHSYPSLGASLLPCLTEGGFRWRMSAEIKGEETK